MKPADINIDVKRVPEGGYWSDVWNQVPWCASARGGLSLTGTPASVSWPGVIAWSPNRDRHCAIPRHRPGILEEVPMRISRIGVDGLGQEDLIEITAVPVD